MKKSVFVLALIIVLAGATFFVISLTINKEKPKKERRNHAVELSHGVGIINKKMIDDVYMEDLESVDLTDQEMKDQKTRDSLFEEVHQPLSLKEFSDSQMSEKKDLQVTDKQKLDQGVKEENNYCFAKLFFLALIVAALLLAFNQWTYRFDTKVVGKKFPQKR